MIPIFHTLFSISLNNFTYRIIVMNTDDNSLLGHFIRGGVVDFAGETRLLHIRFIRFVGLYGRGDLNHWLQLLFLLFCL